MNSGATIFDDPETVEFLRDRPHLLAIADAVRATQRERTRSALRGKPLLIDDRAAFLERVKNKQYNARDLEFTYQYSSFGVPGLGLKRGLGDDAVVAPYATTLAATSLLAPA